MTVPTLEELTALIGVDNVEKLTGAGLSVVYDLTEDDISDASLGGNVVLHTVVENEKPTTHPCKIVWTQEFRTDNAQRGALYVSPAYFKNWYGSQGR